MHELINLRDAALRLATGERAGEVLNDQPPPAHVPTLTPDALAAALRDLKVAAISADGAQVDYAALAHSPAYAAYRDLTYGLRSFDLAQLDQRPTQLAFWINLYNGLVLDAVVRYGIRRSVTERLAGLGFFRRAAYQIGGLRWSADDIEHGVLRSNAGNPFLPGRQFAATDPRCAAMLTPLDPRIHFALNCASRSCPPIATYAAERIEAQLELATRSFVAADTGIDPGRGALVVSAIYGWYRADFGGPGGIVQFIRSYLPADERRDWLDAQAEVDLIFSRYDWALNS